MSDGYQHFFAVAKKNGDLLLFVDVREAWWKSGPSDKNGTEMGDAEKQGARWCETERSAFDSNHKITINKLQDGKAYEND